MNDKLEIIWKKVVMAYFMALAQQLLWWTKKNHENLSQNNWSLCWDSNPRSHSSVNHFVHCPQGAFHHMSAALVNDIRNVVLNNDQNIKRVW